jgi:hypothetical protein
LDQTELLQLVADVFERRGIVYAITGSHASMAYGEHRFTNDIDVIAKIEAEQLDGLIAEFPKEEFYVSDIGARHAVTSGGQFNIIHPTSGLKVDVIVPREPGWPDQFVRRRHLATASNSDAWFISPEDLILKKMHFYREGESDRHLRDIASMLKTSGAKIDRNYIDEWSKKLGLAEIWSELTKRVP